MPRFRDKKVRIWKTSFLQNEKENDLQNGITKRLRKTISQNERQNDLAKRLRKTISQNDLENGVTKRSRKTTSQNDLVERDAA